MKYRNLGKHGIKVSEISLGTMYYGSYLKTKEALACLNEAVNQGINYIDSADRYGVHDSNLPADELMRAELVIGEFLKDQDREDLVISSKLWYKMRDSANSGGLGRKHIRESIQTTLKNLGTDYLDIYYCHRPDPNTPYEETIRAMTNLVDEGLVHHWGTSWFPPWMVQKIIGIAEANGLVPPSVEQPPYHLGARFIEADLIPMAKDNGLGIVSFEGLNSGVFTGKYVGAEGEVVIDQGTRASRPDEREQFETAIRTHYAEKIVKLRELASSLEISLGHMALAWTLRHPEISSSLVGATKPEHVVDNAAASGITLQAETIEKIEEIMANKPRIFYR